MKKLGFKIFFFSVLVLSGAQLSAFAQTNKKDYQERIDIIHKNINQYFKDQEKGLYYETVGKQKENPHSWLWPLCALIQATNELEVLNKKENYMKPIENAINQYYTTVSPAPSYQDYVTKERLSSRFYDDNQWIAIAYLDAYNRTGKKDYLNKTKEIYRWLLTGYDEVSGGGLYWKEGDKNSKNTCSNGPNVLVSLELYKITKEKKYLDTALLVYNWTNKYLRSKEGVFYDALKIPSLKVDSNTYTYNTGTMLQSNVLLYEITGKKQYLDEAKTIATAAEKHFYKNGKLSGHYWFNAVFLRGYIALYQVEKDPLRLKFIMDDADRVWNEERDERNLLGRGKDKSLLMQAGILEVYTRLANLNLTKT